MTTKFQYTFRKINLTVEVEFDFSLMIDYSNYSDLEPFVDLIEINSVKCGELDLTSLFDSEADNKAQIELYYACRDYASRD